MMTKLIGELASVTAETVTTGDEVKTTKEGRALNSFADKTGTVICTELNRQGLLSDELYLHEKAQKHFTDMPKETVAGYQVWANKCVPVLAKSPRLSKAVLPIAKSRYEMITGQGFRFLGALTIYIGQPICYMIGSFISTGDSHGRFESNS